MAALCSLLMAHRRLLIAHLLPAIFFETLANLAAGRRSWRLVEARDRGACAGAFYLALPADRARHSWPAIRSARRSSRGSAWRHPRPIVSLPCSRASALRRAEADRLPAVSRRSSLRELFRWSAPKQNS